MTVLLVFAAYLVGVIGTLLAQAVVRRARDGGGRS